MKLRDLRRQRREAPAVKPAELRRLPVDELDDFLIERGTMTPPERIDTPFKGRRADVVIIDDPIKEALALPICPLVGPPGPVDESKPHNVETLLRRGEWAPKTGAPSSFPGTIVYDPEDDELAQVEGIADPLAGTITLWYGERVPAGKVTKQRLACRLYVVEYKSCHGCRGAYTPVKCIICNGLRVAPTARGLEPWREEKRERARRER